MGIVSFAKGASLAPCIMVVFSLACSSSSDDGKTASSGGSGCSGDITECTLGSLSADQRGEECDLILATIDDPAGTKYECTSGPEQGQYLEVRAKDQCEGQAFPATCKVTVGEVIDCYKAAANDACAAFASGGACAVFTDATTQQQCAAQ